MKKKILLTINDISIVGGAERVVVNLANALSELGYEVEILSFYKRDDKIFYDINNQIKINFYHTLSKESIRDSYQKIYFKNLYRIHMSYKMKRYMQDSDIVIASDDTFFPYFKNKNTKYIRICHVGTEKFHNRFKYYEIHTTLTNDKKTSWQTYHNHIEVIPNFLPYFSSKNAKCDSKIILSVGRLTYQKGFDRLIDIFAMTHHKDWQLHIVGDGEEKAQLESKIEQYNLKDRIILKPFTKNVEQEYLNASIYAMSSYYEGLPMVLLEACSYALPCVSFDIKNGPRDILDDGKCGILINDNDNASFAKALDMLMDTHSMRLELGSKAKQHTKENFSKDAIMSKWVELIER